VPNDQLRILSLLVVALLTLVLAVACSQATDEPGAAGVAAPDPIFPVPEGGMTLQFVRDPVPVAELEMVDLDGRVMSTRNWQGKVTLVNFWATWCGPCREEIPFLVQLAERYPDHLRIIGVSEDEGAPGKVHDFARQYGINYPIVMSTTEIKRQFPGVFALPTTFVLDPDGKIVQTHVGLVSPAVFEQEARHLMSLPANVTVETVEENAQLRLANAAQATEIPGLDLSMLSVDQKELALQRLNADSCTCGCQLTLAQCRINDGACGLSLPLAQKVVEEIVAGN